MADGNENGIEPTEEVVAAPAQPEPQAEAAAPAPEASAPEPAAPAAEAASPEKVATPLSAAEAKERDDTFSIFQNALENVDWEYKLKSGNDRDIGHKSMMIAERAYIAASVYDPQKADKIYEQTAGKPPKEELIKRAADHRQALASQGKGLGSGVDGIKLADLTAGIASVGERRDLAKLHAGKDELEKKMGNWNSVLGDAAERGRSHMKAGNDQLLKQEKPSQTGMHLFAAFRSGMRAADEYGAMSEHHRKHRATLMTVREQGREYRSINQQIAAFGKVGGIEMKDTTGPSGQTVARFQKAFGVVKSALDKGPNGGPNRTAGVETPGATKSPAAGVARTAADIAKMAMGQGQGMGR